ncbi:MAG: HD-like signal output (HDOD) protein [Lentisphaeria bacterium]|jgi:HD-like signal output (HDOD) protein
MAIYGLKGWVDKLKSRNLPVLGSVITELNKITGSDDSDVNQLAEVILRDPNLTSHVLKVANSVQYNLSKGQINTVSRAIVNIGLKGVRAICISSMVMDSLLKDKPKERTLELIARGFHAATQARNLLKNMNQEVGEEVFIAALLFNLGEMAFWASEKVDHNNADLFSDSPKVRRDAMEKILGTSFKSITRELAKQWNLGETLEQALFPRADAPDKIKAVVTGERLSRAALYGWESPQLKKVLQEVCDYTCMPMEEALKKVKQGGDQAAEAALSYGVPEACPLIPKSFEDFAVEREYPSKKIMKGDSGLQLNILRELSSATTDGMDVNTMFQMVLEGIHRGIGLERVCVGFIKGHRLIAKYLLGEGTEQWRTIFDLDVGPFTDSIFTYAMEKGGSHWFTRDRIGQDAYLYPSDVVTVVGKTPSFVHAIEIEKRKVAIFYADRFKFGGKLSEEQYDCFKHFASQAQLSLNVLSRKKISSASGTSRRY